MKPLLKILLSPISAIMWIAIKISTAAIYVSGLILGIMSVIFAVISVVYFISGSMPKGLMGLAIAYLVSPYGIPMFAIIILGAIQRLRAILNGLIY